MLRTQRDESPFYTFRLSRAARSENTPSFPLLQQTMAVRTEIYWNVFAYLTGTSCEEQEVAANERDASR